MPKSESIEVIRTHLLEHPAVKACSELQLDVVKLEGIHILKPGGKSAVYRLEGVGAGKSAVIAKRCRQATATVERTIYEEVLPHLSLMGLHYYGFVEAEDGQFCWLFLDDAGEEEYSPFLEEHRALAARWLGALHTSAANVPAVAGLGLPDRGPRHYLEVLRSARDAIKGNLTNLTLKSDYVVVLPSIVSHCDRLESCWSQVEKILGWIPRTLVHGDFVEKNLRVRTNGAGKVLISFDWETAGWGVPVSDLAHLSLWPAESLASSEIAAYGSLARNYWPRLQLHTLRQLVKIGKIFRCLIAIG